jgi:hypothetical protein
MERTKKLTLKKWTIRKLTDNALRGVAGGIEYLMPEGDSIAANCFPSQHNTSCGDSCVHCNSFAGRAC